MALTWDIRSIIDNEEIAPTGPDWDKTWLIIWTTIAVDMGEITASNWQEFYARVHLWETIQSFDAVITPADVKRRIGLKCNVAYVPRKQWLNRVIGARLDEWQAHATFETESGDE